MTCRHIIGILLLVPGLSVAQTPDLPRTTWGTPDLSGYWEYRTTTPLQRPEELAGKIVLTTEEEVAYLDGRHAAIGRERDLQLNADWWQPGGLTGGRTALVVDPVDGRIPSPSMAAQARVRTLGLASRLRSADGPEDRERYERCIMGRTVPLLAVAPNRLAQFFQTANHIVILHEQNWDVRIIPIHDTRVERGLSEQIRQWQGASRGHWDGDTLVIETKNLNGEWTLAGTSRNARFEERIAIRDAGTLDYRFTVHDPESFGGAWTAAFPVTRAAGPLFENACHEGNYSMPLILRGARALERGKELRR